MKRVNQFLAGLAIVVVGAQSHASCPQVQLPNSAVPDLVAGLAFVSLSQEVASANYTISSEDARVEDTELWTLKVPWERDFDVGSEWGTLYVEGVAAWLDATDRLEVASVLGPATLKQDWTVLGALGGAGWTFPIAERWSVRPAVSCALSHIDNDAHYNDAALQLFAPALDGVVVNWDAWAMTTLVSLSVLYERPIASNHLSVHARWSWAYSDVFRASDSEQETSDASEYLVVRGDLDGPVPLRLADQLVQWGAFAGYSGFYGIDHDALGFSTLYELGASLTAPMPESLPGLKCSAAWIFGPDISGWSIGVSVSL